MLNNYHKLKKGGLALLLLVIMAAFTAPTERYFEIARNLDIFATLYKEVNAYYVDEIDPDKVMRIGIDAMLASLDPYTNYIPEDEIENFRTMTTGQYAGIGALIGNINNKTVITMPYQDFAAYNAGLKIGDELIAVDGKEIKGKSVSDISLLLKGQAKTPVSLTIKRYGFEEPLEFNFKREKITVSNVPYYGILTDHVGYVRLEDFTSNAGKEVEKAVKELQEKGAQKIVLDLRGNPGGLLNEAVNVSNIFLPKHQEIVTTKGKVKEWNKTYKTLNNPVDTEIPLAILIDGGSASASEIVAGAVQDYDRGVLIGKKTFGKGLVQATRPLSYNSQLKVTTAKYYIPSGRCIQSLDYSKRGLNGKVNKRADSLLVEFKTSNGRSVFDGSGLDPDIDVHGEKYAPITKSLLQKGLIFEYATQYASKRDQIPPAKKFRITDMEYLEFTEWLQDKDYDYTTQVEEELDHLKTFAKKEKYFKNIQDQLLALEHKVKHDKERDLHNFKPEIMKVLNEEIVSHFYNQHGKIEASLVDDPAVLTAVKILNNGEKYHQLLSGK